MATRTSKYPRISQNAINAIPSKNGTILKGEHMAIIKAVFMQAVNESKIDIDKIITGDTDIPTVYGADISAVNALIGTIEPVEGDYAVLFRDKEAGDGVFACKFNGTAYEIAFELNFLMMREAVRAVEEANTALEDQVQEIKDDIDLINQEITDIQEDVGTLQEDVSDIKVDYLKRDGTLPMLGNLDLNVYDIKNVNDLTTLILKVTEIKAREGFTDKIHISDDVKMALSKIFDMSWGTLLNVALLTGTSAQLQSIQTRNIGANPYGDVIQVFSDLEVDVSKYLSAKLLKVLEIDTKDDVANIKIKKDLDMLANRIYNTIKGTALNDVATMENVKDHDESETAHLFLRELIQKLQQEIDRLDGKGRSYGEINYLQSELEAMTVSARDTAIVNDIISRYPDYTQENGDLIYTKNEDDENAHEWEFNVTTWVDNGQWTVDKASNTEFGIVRGNDYVSIVSGLMQILKSDYAQHLGTSANAYTYESLASIIQGINTALGNRYTKSETYNRDEIDAMEDELLLLIETLKAVYGWQESNVAQLNSVDNTVPKLTIDEYDFITLNYRDDSEDRVYTQIIKPSLLLNGDIVQLGLVTFGHDNTTYTATNLEIGDTLFVIGIKMDGSIRDEVRDVGDTFIVRDDKGLLVDVLGQEVQTQIIRDVNGKFVKSIDHYSLDDTIYETTLKRDSNGNVVKIMKEKVV